jgi:hypothetical protein
LHTIPPLFAQKKWPAQKPGLQKKINNAFELAIFLAWKSHGWLSYL